MARVVVLFNLKDDVDVAVYEDWARSTDLPVVNNLESVDQFTVHRSVGLLTGEGEAPYDYVEILDINNMETFAGELAEDNMQKVAAEFNSFADNPVFILAEAL